MSSPRRDALTRITRRAALLAGIGAAVGGAVALAAVGHAHLSAMRQNIARSSMPNVGSYDLASRLFFGPVFERIARAIVAEGGRLRAEGGHLQAEGATLAAPDTPPGDGLAVLDIGCGPGHLAIRLARRAPGWRVTGADLDPAMVAQAEANAQRAFGRGDLDRPTFTVGDVGALSFPDDSFDLVVSTFSLHHWADPAAGFAELYRVLRPGGKALIWDVAGVLRHIENRGPGPAELAAASPFGSLELGGRYGLGSIVLAERYDLVRSAA